MSYVTESWAKAAQTLTKHFEKRGISSYYCETKEEALNKVLSLMPKGSSVSWGGSESMVQAGVMDAIKNEDYHLIDRHAAKTPQEAKALYSQAVCSDFYLMSTNAFTADGQLVNIDGAGNRVACLSFGPSHVIVLASMDKMCATVEDAINRVRTLASPPNAVRVGAATPCAKIGICSDCLSPDCICCETLITRKSRIPGRIIVVLVGEHLGF